MDVMKKMVIIVLVGFLNGCAVNPSNQIAVQDSVSTLSSIASLVESYPEIAILSLIGGTIYNAVQYRQKNEVPTKKISDLEIEIQQLQKLILEMQAEQSAEDNNNDEETVDFDISYPDNRVHN